MSILLSDLIAEYPCHVQGDISARIITSLEYRSTSASADCLFFCMPGASRDGHDFAIPVYDSGCRAFVVERILPLPSDAVQIVVSSSRAALASFAARFFDNPATKLTLIGITGTKGKTTTSILIREILCSNGIPCAYIGSNGVIIGNRHFETINTTPESRELHYYFSMMVEYGITHVVMEVSSQALNNFRIQGLTFHTVIYTNLSHDHIGAGEHASFEEYKEAKRKLFTDYGAKYVIYNADDSHASYMIQHTDAECISYAIDSPADFRGGCVQPYRDATSLGIDFDVTKDGIRTGVKLRTPGEFSVYNGLAAIAACTKQGLTVRNCADSLKTISIQGRFEIVDAVEGITFIIDYAHNGISLTNALSVLRKYEPKRLICVVGSVGGRTFVRRRELAEAASNLADFTVFTSDNPDFEDPDDIIAEMLLYFDKNKPYVSIPDREEAVRFAVRIANEGDILLFAGKGHENYQLVRGEKVPFSEKTILLDEAAKVLEKI